jgi:hypothetical protein
MKRRAYCKSVLLALADDCADDGSSAFTSVRTIASETELGTRTVDQCLRLLYEHRFLDVQARPRQHRPRTWKLNLGTIVAFSDTQVFAILKASAAEWPESQVFAYLTDAESHAAAYLERFGTEPEQRSWSQDHARLIPSGSQNWNPDTQKRSSGSHDPATELLTVQRTKDSTRFREQAQAPNGNNFKPISAIVRDVLAETPGASPSDLVALTKQRCAELSIDYGRDTAVPFNIVHQAVESVLEQKRRGGL